MHFSKQLQILPLSLFEVRALGVELQSLTVDVNSSNTNEAAVRLFLWQRKLANRREIARHGALVGGRGHDLILVETLGTAFDDTRLACRNCTVGGFSRFTNRSRYYHDSESVRLSLYPVPGKRG